MEWYQHFSRRSPPSRGSIRARLREDERAVPRLCHRYVKPLECGNWYQLHNAPKPDVWG